jgi:serine/threonine protein phosphatase PrpC
VASDSPPSPFFSAHPQDLGGLSIRVSPLTDIGRKRKNNEDNYLVLPLDGEIPYHDTGELVFPIGAAGLLLAVADGMGGHQSGEVASRLCVEHLGEELFRRLPETDSQDEDITRPLREAVEATHQVVYNESLKDPAYEGMGSTITAAVLQSQRITLAQVGDSRAYLYRQGVLSLMTEDQTLGNLIRDDEGSRLGGHASDILIQAMGAQPEVNVVMTFARVEPYDVVLLCSDGLYKVVSDQEILQTLGLDAPLKSRAENLIRQANENGGPDNITVILAEIEPLGEINAQA